MLPCRLLIGDVALGPHCVEIHLILRDFHVMVDILFLGRSIRFGVHEFLDFYHVGLTNADS